MKNEITDKIRNTLRIEDVIGRTVSLRKTQRGWIGLCPFHDDKSPSFHVYADSQSYYCFACHESGDIFTFLMKTKHLTFPEALRLLADEAGIKLRKNSRGNSRSIYDVLNMAQEYFTSCMSKLPAGRVYLEGRGISLEHAGTFGLGYAPDAWDNLIKFLTQRGIEPGMMLSSGLVIQNERGMYDRFRGRVMFPIRDIAGRIIAFGGRSIVPNVGAKYINSPESDIYRKRNNLYLLNMAGSVIREKGYSVLCEGYMDALRLHMAGFRESVASLGTSLTAEQAGLLKRFSDRCYICYDGDSAGQKASVRGMYILAESGLNVRIIRLPSGKDPDDFLRENPPELFQKAIDEALPLIQYHIEMLRPELEDELRRKSALSELWEGVRQLGADEGLRHLASLSGAFMLPPEEMKRRILGGRKVTSSPKTYHSPEIETVDNGLECAFCAMLMRNRECRLSTSIDDIHRLITDEEAMYTAESVIDGNPDELSEVWRTVGDMGKIGVITRGEIFLSEMKGLDDAGKWEKVCAGLERLRIMRRIREIYAKMSTNTATNDEAIEFTELQHRLQGLKI